MQARIDGGFYPDSLPRDLERAIAGKSVRLHHNQIPPAWRPDRWTWSLYELRGEELVGVPVWRPGEPNPPAAWTVPVVDDHPALRNDPRGNVELVTNRAARRRAAKQT